MELHFLNRSAAWLSCPFREAAARLAEDPDFLLLSRGCIVNLNNVHGIDFDTCYLKNGEQLPVSRREHPNVKKHYNDFLFRKMDQRKDGAI